MRIVIWGINYRPESTGIAPFNTDLAQFLVGRGHQVAMVTGFAYYPAWKKASADSGRLYRHDRIEGVEVYRCWKYIPRRVATVSRILHELSFCATSWLRALFLRRADIYIVVSPPLLLGFCAWLLTGLKRSRYVFHVQDLQPDAAVGLGMVKGGGFIKMLYALEGFAYRHAAAVSGISAGMIAEFARKGVPPANILYFPNWLRASPLGLSPPGEFRRSRGIAAGTFLAVYSGNLGRKQGIDILLQAAEQLSKDGAAGNGGVSVMILIAGAGAERDALARRIEALNSDRLRLLDLLSDEEYAGMLVDANVGLITQAPGTGQYFFPSKLLSLLQAGLPVVTVADESSELAQAVAAGGFGVNVRPESPRELAEVLARLSRAPDELAGLRARTAWVTKFAPTVVLPSFEREIEKIVNEC